MSNIEHFNSKDDLLISKFMKENRQEIENIDFSRKIVNKVKPTKNIYLAYLVSFIGGAICCTIFFIFDGTKTIYNLLQNIYNAYLSLAAETLQLPILKLAIISLAVCVSAIIISRQYLSSANDI